jgi:protein-L-isoaspartate(D-aspartate) O-methyltransferase
MNPDDFTALRAQMVDRHVSGRGVRSSRVLEAMRIVPRERFVPETLLEFACDDLLLPVALDQVLPRPSEVGMMLAALDPKASGKVLEIGTGAGYVTALLSHLSRRVFSVEPEAQVAASAAAALGRMDLTNVQVRHQPAQAGWPEMAPFDAILVHGIARQVPAELKEQLAIGGRLVMTLGADPDVGELVRVTRLADGGFRTDDIADISADTPLGEEPLAAAHPGAIWSRTRRAGEAEAADRALAQAIAAVAERFASTATADLEPLLRRIGDSRIVLLGEASHGTSDFYRLRARITQELITRKGFTFVAIEGDWPDAARIDAHVRGGHSGAAPWSAFARFPTWMWRNQEVRHFVEWLRAHNAHGPGQVAFHGLDLYSLHNSIHAVLGYLDEVDPATARVARQRYGCLTPWQSDPASYGLAALTARYRSCEQQVVSMLADLQRKGPLYAAHDGARLLDALQNARVVSQAESYYRTMYYGSRAAWNLRDSHMFDTLEHLLAYHGGQSKAVVWAHNSHVGDSAATEMSLRGEFNLGHLCRARFGSAAYLVGFGTNTGTVAAASEWDAPMEVKHVRPALKGSYEHLFHDTGVPRFLLPLRPPASPAIIDGLDQPRLERAIGVIYRPETERHSHYFDAVLSRQFDEYVWFDDSRAVTPLKTEEIEGLPETYPFGL